MAEERLIDADKDKKYRIKINADGEEELVVDEGVEPVEEVVQEVLFEVEEISEDNEEEAVMTPEQLAAKREREERERAERRAKAEEHLKKALGECALYRYSTALEELEAAEELDAENGEIYALRLTAYTRAFTDYSQIIPAAECAADIKRYASEERKKELCEKAAPSLEQNIAQLRAQVSSMNEENERKKAERAVKFKDDRKIALIVFASLAVLLVGLVALSSYFATIIYTVSTGKYLILTCVFGGLSFIALLALAFAARYLNITCRRVKLNKRNTATQLGRDLLKEQEKLKAFIAVYSALKGE